MGEASIRAEGASSNALGGRGFVKAAESDDTRAKLFRAFSTHLAGRAATAPNGAKSTPVGSMDRPPVSRARRGV
jgi:hypothetical protein